MYAVVTPVRSEVPVTSAIMVVTILPNGLMVDSSSHQAMTDWAGGLFDASKARVGHAWDEAISSPLSSAWQRSEPVTWVWQWQATRPTFLRARRGRTCTAALR